MPRRTHLRNRVLLLTGAFAIVLFAVTFGLSWRAKRSQERWSRIIGVETQAIAVLEELVRAQNAFRARLVPGPGAAERYVVVEQLLDDRTLSTTDLRALRGRARAFRTVIEEAQPRVEDVDATSRAVVDEALNMVGARKQEIARTIPALERDTSAMMVSGLAVAWIVVILSFAVVQTMLRKVVRPLEELSVAADRIAAGDLTVRAPVKGDHEIFTLGVAFNRMADELKARARTDELTGLPNFRSFCERLDVELDRAERYPEAFGVLILDLDRFKRYNDDFGHLAGNGALQRVAGVIRETVRTVDFAARYGGEEFAVIVPEIEGGESLAAIANRIRTNIEALAAPEGERTITMSIGGALYPQDGTTPSALFHAADARLYDAKDRGRNCAVIPESAVAGEAVV